MAYEVTALAPDCWAIQDGNVRMYLLDGGSDAFLIDTGYGSGDLKKLVTSLVSGRIRVINTHCHADHTSGNRQFETFYMGAPDAVNILPACPPDSRFHLVKDGDVIAAGTVSLKVIAIPGHTPGAIALLDEKHRFLFSGDTFAKLFPIYMQFPGQELEAYLHSMLKLRERETDFDRICPCHGELVIEKDYMRKTIECVRGILSGEILPSTARNSDNGYERAYWFEDVAIFH